jgi:osmotically-inducible protein OsmY
MRQQHGREYPQRTSYAGRGPKGYKRSDERIREDVSEALTRSHEVDATNIEVAVNDGIVTLTGSVDDRHAKRMAEDVAQDVSGVRDVQNQLRVQPSSFFGNAENKGPGASDTSRAQNSGSVLGLSAEAGGRR